MKYNKSMLNNAYNDLLQEKDIRSMELFDKHYCELSIAEIDKLEKYMYDLSNPIWKPIMIDGKDSGYKISNIGTAVDSNNNELKYYQNSSGYLVIWIHIKGKRNNVPKSIHRLVAESFIPNPDNKSEVNHINCKQNMNWVGNLEWVTHEENIRYMINCGNQVIGMNHKNSKFTDEQIHLVCKMLENPNNDIKTISEKTKVSLRTIQNIRFYNGWNHISGLYNINRSKYVKGPKFSYVSKIISDMVNNGKTNSEIRNKLHELGLDLNITSKSISDRIYHIRKLESNKTSSTIEKL